MDLRQWNGASYSPSKGRRPRDSAPKYLAGEYLAPKYSDARAAFDRYDKDHDHALSKAECVDCVGLRWGSRGLYGHPRATPRDT